jgi:hypothetical protein
MRFVGVHQTIVNSFVVERQTRKYQSNREFDRTQKDQEVDRTQKDQVDRTQKDQVDRTMEQLKWELNRNEVEVELNQVAVQRTSSMEGG